jgi:hypothetical protein
MGEIVNLRRARKRKARVGLEARAAANRAEFGRNRAERNGALRLRDLEAMRLDGHRRDGAKSAADDVPQ